jgi:hypothetical protein
MSAKPPIFSFSLIGEEGDAKRVSGIKGKATKKGKLVGNDVKVKNGIM